MSEYEEAVGQLRMPETWCDGAETLAKLGDARALIPLMRAYESRAEVGKSCLYEAMEKLGGDREARNLFTRGDVEERLVGLHLMELFASDENLRVLEAAATGDGDERVRARALYVLGLQRQTPRWEALMVRLLNAPDEKLRGAAIESLATRYTDSAHEALRAHLSRETSETLRSKLDAAIQSAGRM